MATKSIPVLNENPSRAEELAFLRAVIERVPAQSYLAALLHAGVLDWFEMQMKHDLSCDLYGAHEHAVLNWGQAADEARKAEAEVKRLEGRLRAEQEATQRAVAEGDEAAEHWRTEAEYWRKKAGDLSGQLGAAQDDCRAMKEEITALKARLFDVYAEAGRI